MTEVLDIADHLVTQAIYPCALATLVKVEGSSYRRRGARRLIGPTVSAVGAISGGCLEKDIDEHARGLILSSSTCKLITYDTSSENDILWGAGTGCHGIIHILIEKLNDCPAWAHEVQRVKFHRNAVQLQTRWAPSQSGEAVLGTALGSGEAHDAETSLIQVISPPRRLVIFGAGDDAIPLNGLANQLGWETKIFDPRASFATNARFPGATSVECHPAETAASQTDWDDHTFAVIMTHHYRFDLPLLQTLLPLNLPYLGLLGPKQRGEKLLTDAGFSTQQDSLHSPVGLDLGGDGAEAVALAVVSEIQAHLHQRPASPLRERHQPIHDH